jgi:hypothetical protein
MRNIFSGDYLLVAGQTSPEDALGDNDYPASGSYIDVTGYEWVNIIVHLGFVHASDTPVFEVKQAEAVNGTLDVIDATNAKHTCAADDDDEMVSFYIETANLATDHHFLSVVCTLSTTGSYADIVYFLGGARRQPVTQTTALLPTASQHIFAG